MLLRFAGVLATLLLAAAPQLADEPKAGQEAALADLSLDVQAFRAIYMLKLTDTQLKQVAMWAKETSAPRSKRPEPKAGASVRNVLTSLRAALLEGTDDDKIGDLEDELEQIVESENPKLDDSFDITKAARKRTPQLLKDLKADQFAAFAEVAADDIIDPVQHLIKALEQVRGLKGTAWTEKRDEIADDIAWAVAGVNQAAPVIAKVNALLTKRGPRAKPISRQANRPWKKRPGTLSGRSQWTTCYAITPNARSPICFPTHASKRRSRQRSNELAAR